MRMYLPCTWIPRTFDLARRGGTGPATMCWNIVEGFSPINLIQAPKLQATALSLLRTMLDEHILNLPRSLIYSLECHLDCYLVAIIGLGGFQKNMRRTGIESHHSH